VAQTFYHAKNGLSSRDHIGSPAAANIITCLGYPMEKRAIHQQERKDLENGLTVSIRE